MNGELHERGGGDHRDDPDSKIQDAGREEILRALAGLDKRLRADAEDAYSLLAKGTLHSKLGVLRRLKNAPFH